MKTIKHTLWMMGLISSLCITNAHAQTVQENELAMVYYLPKTQIVVDIAYTRQVLEAGPFWHFAEELLGITDVIEQNDTLYSISDVTCQVKTSADLSRAYKILASGELETQLLSLTKDGRLLGYNIMPESVSKSSKSPKETAIAEHQPRIIPILEDQLKARSLHDMALGVAKQIYRIRETRMYILSGEVDHAPADGKAMKLVLDELNRQEKELTQLFCGYRTTTLCHEKITYLPTKTEDVTIAYFSQTTGVSVEQQDESDTPVVLHCLAHKQLRQAATQQDKKAPKASAIYYNLPGSADINIQCAEQDLFSHTYQVAQLGIAIPLAERYISGKQPYHIELDPHTGNIRSIYKQ